MPDDYAVQSMCSKDIERHTAFALVMISKNGRSYDMHVEFGSIFIMCLNYIEKFASILIENVCKNVVIAMM